MVSLHLYFLKCYNTLPSATHSTPPHCLHPGFPAGFPEHRSWNWCQGSCDSEVSTRNQRLVPSGEQAREGALLTGAQWGIGLRSLDSQLPGRSSVFIPLSQKCFLPVHCYRASKMLATGLGGGGSVGNGLAVRV